MAKWVTKYEIYFHWFGAQMERICKTSRISQVGLCSFTKADVNGFRTPSPPCLSSRLQRIATPDVVDTSEAAASRSDQIEVDSISANTTNQAAVARF